MRNNYLLPAGLLLVMLFLSVAAWGQQSLNISNGNIIITPSGYTVGNGSETSFTGNYSITQSSPSSPTSNTITIKDEYNGTITLDNVNIETNQEKTVPFHADKAGQITLLLKGENKLTNGYSSEGNQNPGLATPWGNGCGITIADAPADIGTLTAKGCKRSPGIGLIYRGLFNFAPGSYITINSGIITAASDENSVVGGAGIGTSWGNTEINYGGTITINGGVVTATGGERAAGIGGGSSMNGGTIIINGGTVIATGGESSPSGIGSGSNNNNNKSTFSTGENGHAFIIANKGITGTTQKDNWKGVVFENKSGRIYGKNVGITTDATIPDGYTLTVGSGEVLAIDGCKLTVASGGTLTNNGGKIITLNGGSIDGYNGDVISSGYFITYHANCGDTEQTITNYAGGTTTLPDDLFTRPYYTFKGWYTDQIDETSGAITQATEAKTLYAHWTLNTFSLTTLAAPTLIYGTTMESINLSLLLSDNAVTNCGNITFSASNLPNGLTCSNEGVISGTPTAASNGSGKSVTVTATAANTSTATQTVIFTVGKATPDLSVNAPSFENSTYDGNAKEASATVTGISGESASLTATLTYYVGGDTNTQTTAANSGASGDGQTPVNAGTYTVKASFAGNDNYEAATDQTQTFAIAPKKITVVWLNAVTKEYDGGNSITSSPSLVLNNVIDADKDKVSLNSNSHTFTFATTDVANDIKINVSPDLALAGDKAGCYKLGTLDLKGNITARTLTVTPGSNQFVYADETNTLAPAYGYSGNVAEQPPAFSGKLAWGGSVITKGDLALADGDGFRAGNYTLSVVENVGYTSHSENLSDAVASPSTEAGHEGSNGWSTATVTLTAPENFKIRSTAAPDLRSTDDWTATTITFNDEGEYTAWYQLKRDGRMPNAAQSIDIKLDKTAPAIGTIQAVGSSFTLSLTDEASGIATIAYTLDGEAEVEVSSGFAPGDKAYTLNIPAGYGEHTVSVTVTDMAGLSTTISRNITLTNPTPPVDPAPTVYYTVTLPAVEGAVTNPVAGEYKVGAWDSFRFYLRLDDEYDQSVPVVTTCLGETIVHRSSDGAYVVKYVRNDVEIFITGIAKNDSPVGNETIAAAGTKVWTANGCLYLLPATDDKAFIYTADGTLYTMRLLHTGEEQVLQLRTGVYIIRIGNRSYKVVM